MSCLGYLSCPVCGEALAPSGPSARCPHGHSFDFARSGYLNLDRAGPGRRRRGDTAAMVRARAEFLAGSHYAPLVDSVAAAAADAAAPSSRTLVEIGSGTGRYLAAAARRLAAAGLECAVGVDLSKPAAAYAARRHPDLCFVVADVEAAIPLRDSVVDVALSVFAPRPGPELGRMVRPGGGLVVAFAGSEHLQELRLRLGLIGIGERKLEQLRERLEPWFELVSTRQVEHEIELDAESAGRLALMGPNAWHSFDASALEAGITDRVAVVLARFRRSGAAGA